MNDNHLNGSVHEAWKTHVLSPESDAVYEGKNILVRGDLLSLGAKI